MKQHRKWLALALAGALSLSLLAGCAGNEAPDTSANSTAPAETEGTVQETDSGALRIAEQGIFSAGGTVIQSDGTFDVANYYTSREGSTSHVDHANVLYIAEATGGDLFELEPAEPYTDADLNWTDENSRVTLEHEDESLRDVELVADTVDNWDSYDTVFIGYPIWWGIAAWPVDTFVEANDFTGKTVIPFCTSSSSGLGQSGELLAEMAGTGDWLEGQRFRSSASQEDVTEWVVSLGLN